MSNRVKARFSWLVKEGHDRLLGLTNRVSSPDSIIPFSSPLTAFSVTHWGVVTAPK